jgi:hypothetical protein
MTNESFRWICNDRPQKRLFV